MARVPVRGELVDGGAEDDHVISRAVRPRVARLVASVEDASEHPIAQAIAAGARDRSLALAPVGGFASTQGLDVTGIVEGHAVVAGRERFLADWALHLPDDLARARPTPRPRDAPPFSPAGTARRGRC
jgi:cation transport ATPase